MEGFATRNAGGVLDDVFCARAEGPEAMVTVAVNTAHDTIMFPRVAQFIAPGRTTRSATCQLGPV